MKLYYPLEPVSAVRVGDTIHYVVRHARPEWTSLLVTDDYGDEQNIVNFSPDFPTNWDHALRFLEDGRPEPK